MDENRQNERIVIRPYEKAWKIEGKIYAVLNWVLPFPIEPFEALYFALFAVAIFGLSQLFPVLKYLHVFIRYAAAPFGLTRLVSKIKLDGMNPVRFFGAFIIHLITFRLYVENFETREPGENKKIRLDWWCGNVSKPR